MVVTVDADAKNMCMSRRWKADRVGFRTCVHTPAIFVFLVAQKPDHALVCPVCPESEQHGNLTSKIHNDLTVCSNRLYE
jgi:hypothetical protein